MLEKNQPPIFEALMKHKNSHPISFHVPGHKMGKGFNPVGINQYKDILEIDLTEISGLDDLHQPEDIIYRSQERAAKLFKSNATFYLVNGSTVGNLALILSVCQPGDKIIVQRNVHKSVINGIILARAIPIYISPEFIGTLKISGGIEINQLEKALEEHPDAKAVFVMNPNYYGLGKNLTPLIDMAHQYQIPVLVDEAHGAHFGLHSIFPKSAIELGADAVVQSTHKTLAAMTMGSMLHVNSNYLNIQLVKTFLSMLQTSSPSYPIMASLDLTVDWILKQGESIWNGVLNRINEFYIQTANLKETITRHVLPSGYYQDPLKIIIKHKYFTGFELQQYLEKDLIYSELADPLNVLAIATPGSSEEDFTRLFEALLRIEKKTSNINKELRKIDLAENISLTLSLAISPDKVLYKPKKLVSIDQAIDKIAAEMIIPYPPGIPVIQLGERISKESVEYLKYLKGMGAKFSGLKDSTLQQLLIIDQENNGG